MDRQIFADVSQLSLHHPCAARGCNQTGFCSHNPASWPPDAIRGVQRLMWVTRKVSPWKRHHHYIPVASDASDILQQAKWALSNMKETDRIALAALSYARCYLTAKYATLYAAVQVVTTSACAAECGSVRVCRSSSASCRARCSTCMEMAFLSRPKQLMSLISPDCHPS